jgi:hypothetical protein
MFVPNKIKVGYQNREGTYTGKLAYVIYFDHKNKLRKEASWEGWRDKKIDPSEFTNEPMSGFVLNKGVGGYRASYGWDARNEYIRVYDPRDFEFEISVANLLFILQETSAIKGKGLEGEFVYAWDGTELVLLPLGCAEYQACNTHTERQSKKVSAKEVKPGFSYVMKNGTNVMYLGKYEYVAKHHYYGFKKGELKHVFLNLDEPNPEYSWTEPYITTTGFTGLAEAVSTNSLTNFPDELDRFLNSKYYGLIKEIVIEDTKLELEDYRGQSSFIKKGNELIKVYVQCGYYGYGWSEKNRVRKYTIDKSKPFIPELNNNEINLPDESSRHSDISEEEFKQLEFKRLYVVNVKGIKIEVF